MIFIFNPNRSFWNQISVQNINATDFGSKQEAEAMLKKAINVINYDKKYALELFSEGAGGFMFKDLYVFCMSKKGIVIAHPTGVGIDAMANKDSDGNVIAQLVLENAKKTNIRRGQKTAIPRFNPSQGRIKTADGQQLRKVVRVVK